VSIARSEGLYSSKSMSVVPKRHRAHKRVAELAVAIHTKESQALCMPGSRLDIPLTSIPALDFPCCGDEAHISQPRLRMCGSPWGELCRQDIGKRTIFRKGCESRLYPGDSVPLKSIPAKRPRERE